MATGDQTSGRQRGGSEKQCSHLWRSFHIRYENQSALDVLRDLLTYKSKRVVICCTGEASLDHDSPDFVPSVFTCGKPKPSPKKKGKR